MRYFKKILRFALPYRRYGFLNIFFNILYALFSALSFAALIPMLDVLFQQNELLNSNRAISENLPLFDCGRNFRYIELELLP